MKIEVLFPEFCNLFGDISNMKYLKKCIPDAEFYETSFDEIPRFVNENINLIYLGPMTEKMQEKVIKKLMGYKEKIQELINSNVCFLLTGNSFEIFGKYIQNEDESKIDGLGIVNTYAKRDMMHRFNDMILGTFENIKMVGFKNQFTKSYGEIENNYFIQTTMGEGLNETTKLEGIKINNFIGTYLLGPILILNPLFTKYLLEKMGVENPKLAYEKEIMESYNQRLKEFENLSK